VVDGEYERRGDAKLLEVSRKTHALESLALYGQSVEFDFVEFLNYLEQQLIWQVEERHPCSLLLG